MMQQLLPLGYLCFVGEYCVGNRVGYHVTDANEVIGRKHPRDFLASIMANRQCYLWTNNPYAVDCYPADQVMVAKFSSLSGLWQCKPLSDHPDWPRWNGEMSAGEFWSFVGEGWVLEDK